METIIEIALGDLIRVGLISQLTGLCVGAFITIFVLIIQDKAKL